MSTISTRRRIVTFKNSLFHFGSAVRDSMIAEKYTRARFFKDLLAGITVGIIAIPLSMALAIATGVNPEYGLYTALVAGVVIALTGGSRYSISGPTAAFVVILYPVTQTYGMAGLCMASMLAGCFLLIMSAGRLGRLIQFIPIEVTLGFTMGIGIVIAVLQVKDFLGLNIVMPESFVDKLFALAANIGEINWGDAAVGAVTLLTLIVWGKLKIRFPGHLPAVLLGALTAYILTSYAGMEIATIGSRFHYLNPDGTQGNGIPPFLPEFVESSRPRRQTPEFCFCHHSGSYCGGVFHGGAGSHRIPALRRGAGRHDRHPASLQRGALRSGRGQCAGSVLGRHYLHRRHCEIRR